MGMQARSATEPTTPTKERHTSEAPTEYPVREYIGSMVLELAQMARWDGDEPLGRLLDSAASLAAEPVVRAPVERPQTQPRPA